MYMVHRINNHSVYQFKSNVHCIAKIANFNRQINQREGKKKAGGKGIVVVLSGREGVTYRKKRRGEKIMQKAKIVVCVCLIVARRVAFPNPGKLTHSLPMLPAPSPYFCYIVPTSPT